MTFPYLMLVSLVAMLSGLLNARSRFAPGAFAPVLLNLVLIGGIVTGYYLRGPRRRRRDRRLGAGDLAVARRRGAARLHVVGQARAPGCA